MQPSATRSVATAHIDDLMRAAEAYRLAGDDRPRRRRLVAAIKQRVARATPGASLRTHKPQHA